MYKERNTTKVDFGKERPDGSYSGILSAVYPDYSQPGGYQCPADKSERLKTGLNGPSYYQCGDFYGSSLVSWETFSSSEFRPPKWNGCTHKKQNMRFSYPWGYMLPAQWYPGWAYPRNGQHQECHHYTWPQLQHDVNTIVTPKVEIDDFFRSRAMSSMTPRFESDFQALNFLFELKDFKRAPKHLLDVLNPGSPLWGAVGSWNRRWGQALYGPKGRRGEPQTPRWYNGMSAAEAYTGRATSLAAKSWLTYTMAYLPLIKDIAAFGAASAQRYDEALSDFRDKGLNMNTRHYSEYLTDDGNLPDSAPVPGFPDFAVGRLDFSKATASLQYTYKYTLSNQSEALARYWGLTGTSEEFWNMLPFSFLVDYLLQISKALKMVERDKNLTLEPLQYSESLLQYYGTAAHVKHRDTLMCGCIVDGTICKMNRWYPVCGVYSSHYVRSVTPAPMIGLIVPRMKLPSLNQQANIVALARVLLF